MAYLNKNVQNNPKINSYYLLGVSMKVHLVLI